MGCSVSSTLQRVVFWIAGMALCAGCDTKHGGGYTVASGGRAIRDGMPSSDPTVGKLDGLPGGDLDKGVNLCSGTTICSKTKNLGDGISRTYAAVLTAAHCSGRGQYIVPTSPEIGLAVKGSEEVGLKNFNGDKFLVLRVETLPGKNQPEIPYRQIRPFLSDRNYGDLLGSNNIVGWGETGKESDERGQRSGKVDTRWVADGGDTLESLAGNSMACLGDSGGPLSSQSLIIGVQHGVVYNEGKATCANVKSSVHMNAVRYRSEIMAAAERLVPECFPSTCGFSYIGTAYSERYAKYRFPPVPAADLKSYCEGKINKDRKKTNWSYIGVTLLQSPPFFSNTTPAACGCESCGDIDVEVSGGEKLTSISSGGCNPGCRPPESTDIGRMLIRVARRVGVKGKPLPTSPSPLVADDFNPELRRQLTVSCVPDDRLLDSP